MLRIALRDGEVFEGKVALDLVRAMKGASMFSDVRSVSDYLDMVLRNAKHFEDIELRIKGNTMQEKAASLVEELERLELAKLVETDGKENAPKGEKPCQK